MRKREKNIITEHAGQIMETNKQAKEKGMLACAMVFVFGTVGWPQEHASTSE